MSTKYLVLLGLPCLFPAVAAADWLTLQEGTVLRGIDLKKHGKGYRFTLESGEIVSLDAGSVFYYERSPKGEKVEFRGQQVTLEEKIRTLVREKEERTRRAVRLLEAWARGQRDSGEPNQAEAARKEFVQLPEKERARALRSALTSSKVTHARRLAARELSRHESPEVTKALVRAALTDDYRSVRDSCLASLKKAKDPKIPDYFLPALRHKRPRIRTRAANALSVFPARQAVPELVETLHMAWTGFGNAYTTQVTQRAYVADYELVSGGTGFSLVEVADPLVRTNLTGVALDAKVRRVELVARLRALHRATGQRFGADVAKWREWWEAENGK